jgi:hypothetical protein
MMTEISRKEAKSAKNVMLSVSETSLEKVKSQRSKPIKTFSFCLLNFDLKKRSFAYTQDDAFEMCGAGKAERAERSGLPRFFFGYFLCSDDKESNSKKMNIDFILPQTLPNGSGQALQRGIRT